MKKIMCITILLAVCMFQTSASAKELLGAGATFPYPYYSKLFDVDFTTVNLEEPQTTIDFNKRPQ